MKNHFVSNIILVVITVLLISLTTVLQGYWALWEYRSSPSSSCLDCDIFTDLVISSLLPLFLIGLMSLFFFKYNAKWSLRLVLTTLALLTSWLLIDTEIFIEREASWSTYTNVWEVSFRLAIIPVLTVGLLFAFLFHCLIKTSLSRKS